MPIPTLKYAVYYGTIRLDNGQLATYTASHLALLYGVQDEPYVAVPLLGVNPIQNTEYEYVQLKPLSDANYYDAKERYNADMEPYLDRNFDEHSPDKWVHPKLPDAIDDDLS